MTEPRTSQFSGERGDAIARLLGNATAEQAVELLCEALDWTWIYLPSRDEVDRRAEEFRSVIGRRFPAFNGSPILSREASVAITEAARAALAPRCDCGADQGKFFTAHPSGHAVTCATRSGS